MQFTKRLHEPIRAGVVTCTIRIWKRLRVKVGGRYRLGAGPGFVLVDSIEGLDLTDITEALAIESGFDNLTDLMKIAQHGTGEQVYLIRFHYVDAELPPS